MEINKRFGKVLFSFLGIGGWVFIIYLIFRGFYNDGIVYLHFNLYNEMILELFIFIFIGIFMVFFSIIELRDMHGKL